ncbi:MAG: hypothetical protein JKY41_08505 [Rhodobacteraceae bacterium]|nr:hypothetical protein [Paracoccaceae bacterium]
MLRLLRPPRLLLSLRLLLLELPLPLPLLFPLLPWESAGTTEILTVAMTPLKTIAPNAMADIDDCKYLLMRVRPYD